jgi:hypothetical protein
MQQLLPKTFMTVSRQKKNENRLVDIFLAHAE